MRRSACGLVLLTTLVIGCSRPPRGVNPGDVSGDTLVEYVVRPSDSWRGISEDFFGNAENAGRIATDNGFLIGDEPPAGESIDIRILNAELARVRRLADAREPYNAGVAFLASGEFESARSSFEEALDRAPEFVDARYNLGLALLKLGEPDDALEPLGDTVLARADDKDAHYALASAHFHLGDYEGALPIIERALALDPAFLRARFTYALALERLGLAQRSRDAWEEYLRLDGSSAWAREARTHLSELP